MCMKILAKIKKCLTLVIIQATKSKYQDIPNKLVAGKMEDETAGVMIEEFLGLKPKMHSYLVHRNSEHKKKKV